MQRLNFHSHFLHLPFISSYSADISFYSVDISFLFAFKFFSEPTNSNLSSWFHHPLPLPVLGISWSLDPLRPPEPRPLRLPLSNLTALHVFSLKSNFFSDPLPTSFASLYRLGLSANRLSGPISPTSSPTSPPHHAPPHPQPTERLSPLIPFLPLQPNRLQRLLQFSHRHDSSLLSPISQQNSSLNDPKFSQISWFCFCLRNFSWRVTLSSSSSLSFGNNKNLNNEGV